MAGHNVWVDVDRSASAEFTYIPSPVAGGNLGFIVGVERGADLWMRGRGEDGLVRHEMHGHTTYRVGAELEGGARCVVGPVRAIAETVGWAMTRNVGPLKTLVSRIETGFSVFGDEAQARANVRGAIVTDSGFLAEGRATAEGQPSHLVVPEGLSRPLPPLDGRTIERKECGAIQHTAMPGGEECSRMAPFRVSSHVSLEALESGYPGGAHAAGEIEARHRVDLSIRIEGAGGSVEFLRWTSEGGFDERSRAILSPPARKRDDAWKEAVGKEKDRRASQEKAYAAEEAKLASYAAGHGADARMQTELEALEADAAEQHLPEATVKERSEAIRRAYEKKAADNARDRRRLEALVAAVRRRFDEALAAPEGKAATPNPWA